MNSSVCAHYNTHLARYYIWLFGGWEANLDRSRQFISANALTPGTTGRALDLGCGPGFFAIPLAEAGFGVTAVDTSAELLQELAVRASGLAVTPVAGDMIAVLRRDEQQYDVCLCMGDTLAHLGSRSDVVALLGEVYRVLVQGGRLVLSLRNYEHPPTGTERFIPVRADSDRIAMCVLDCAEEYVEVGDILWERNGNDWTMTAGSYRKLRIPVAWLVQCMEDAGFAVVHSESVRGMATLIGRK